MKPYLILSLFGLLFLPTAHAAQTFKTEQWQTKNGAHVVFYQAMEVPMLDIQIAFAAGSAYDGAQFGLSELTANLFDEGSNGMTSDAIADTFATLGAQYSAASSKDMLVLTLRTLTEEKTLKKASETLGVLIHHTDFPTDAFTHEKNQQLMLIEETKESPDALASEAFYRSLYGAHPYAHPTHGTRDHLEALTVHDVRHFYERYIVGRNAVVVLVGAINSASAHVLAEQLVGALPPGQPAPELPLAHPLQDSRDIAILHPSSQTVLQLGQLGITHQNPDYFPLQVGNYILGGGSLVSELAHELREKRGLTYGVYSQFLPMPGIGPFTITLSTKTDQTQEALTVTRETLTNFTKKGPTEEELRAAIQYLTGSFPLSLASNRSLADMLLRIAFYHLPDDFLATYLDHIKAVTTTDIKQAFQRLINPEKLVQITVGK